MNLHHRTEPFDNEFDEYFFYCEPKYQPAKKGYLLAAVKKGVSVGNSSLVSVNYLGGQSDWLEAVFSDNQSFTIRPSCWVDDLTSFDKVFGEDVKMCTPLAALSTWTTLIDVGLFYAPKIEAALKAFEDRSRKIYEAKKAFSEIMIELGAQEETEPDGILLPFTKYCFAEYPTIDFPLA